VQQCSLAYYVGMLYLRHRLWTAKI